MFDRPIDLAEARILVTNDDGIGAPGLKALERVARGLCPDVVVVAPEQEQSGASHSLTLRRPLRIRRLSPRRFAVDGTPTDCVLIAINHILKQRRPTLVLSGINRGGNMGEDVTYSGTIAAAMEATLLEVPAVALSLSVTPGRQAHWDTSERFATEVIRRLVLAPWPRNTLVNVNFPDLAPDEVTGIRAAAQGRRKLGDNLVPTTDPRGTPCFWIGPMRDDDPGTPGTDLAAVAEGAVAVTPIFLDLTHVSALASLRKVFP